MLVVKVRVWAHLVGQSLGLGLLQEAFGCALAFGFAGTDASAVARGNRLTEMQFEPTGTAKARYVW